MNTYGSHHRQIIYHRDAIRYYKHRRCDMFVGRGVNHGIKSTNKIESRRLIANEQLEV